MKDNDRAAEQLAIRWQREYGAKAGATGRTQYKLDVVPTGSLALDYALGIGGWGCGHPIEIMGPPDIGKTSSLGYAALANAQAMNKFCVLIALEPGFDPTWAEANGVNVDQLAIGRPDNGLEAFHMLSDAVMNGAGFILFDSIGAVQRESEARVDGSPSVGGAAALISWGITNVLMKLWKQGVGLILLNQVRDDMKARVSGLLESPGGWALKHSSAVRVQVRMGRPAYMSTINGQNMEIGRNLVCVMKRNKLSQGSRQRADFDYYIRSTPEHPIGIDIATDIINTGMTTGAIKRGGAYYQHPSFPADKNGKNQFMGADSVKEFLLINPEAREQVRKDVLDIMAEKQGPALEVKPTMEVDDGKEG